MADPISENEFLAAFGATNPEGEGTTDDSKQDLDKASDDTTEPEGDAGDAGTDTEGDATSDQDAGDAADDSDEPNQTQTDDKKAHAFAQMRIQNKQQADLLKNIGAVLGVQDTSNPEALTQALQDKVIAAQAKAQGVPEEFYRRLNNLEQNNQQFVQEQMKRTALLGFQKVKESFGLQNKDVEAFADDLYKDGIDPFTNPVDVVKEYKMRNFDKLLADAEARGAAAEAARASKANQHGSSPNNKQGKRNTGDEKINTMKELSNFLANN